ncbi:MAG TPA: ATP-binding cassette domain-containing protein, partial [Acidimicrobiales bacterium]|nr:ATP-binding cassette domain-containing protein [Acidimicrobiales bacterium]
RSDVLAHLEVPHRVGERSRADLALAIEQASAEPGLEALRAAAGAGLLGAVVVFVAAGWLSALIVVALLGVAAPLYARAGRASAAREADYQRVRARLESRQLELLSHAPELRALGAVPYGAASVAALSDAEHERAVAAVRVALTSSLVTEFLSGVSVGLVAMVVGFGLLDGTITLSRALIAVMVTAELFALVRRYGAEFHRREGAARGRSLLAGARRARATGGAAPLVVADALVTEAGGAPVSLRVEPGSRTLVTGPSGAGKTTLLETIVGWRAPAAGTLARAPGPVGVVDATPALLAGSLRENLALGGDHDDPAVRRALAAVALDGERFDDLDAPVGPDGRGFSAGETVRLALARCLLAAPSLIVIDAVGGLLDVESRETCSRALDASAAAVIEAASDASILSSPGARVDLA